MESHKTATQDKKLSRTDNSKVLSELSSSQDDANFDSGADCSYKSGEISVTNISSSEHLSSHSITDRHSKTDQHYSGLDSGIEVNYETSYTESAEISSEKCFKSFESPQSVFEPTIKEKLQWQDLFSQDKDGDT